jgi:two-component system nitrate/nitrite response regulator NarL
MRTGRSQSSGDIRVLIVEDQAIVRAGVRMFLDSQPHIIVVGEAESYPRALDITRSLQPDVILLDLGLGVDTGFDCMEGLYEASRGSRILVLTGVVDKEIRERAVERGASGVVLKSESPDVLLKAIEKVHQGEVWLDRAGMARLLLRLSQQGRRREEAANLSVLTPRERQIIALVAQGYRNREIAEQLAISPVTVRHHLTSIFDKLDVHGRFELLIFAYKNNLSNAQG